MTTKRDPKAIKTVGGKFQSIGTREQQEANVALVTRLIGQIGPPSDHTVNLTVPELIFLTDTRSKLQHAGTKQFGWKQVEEVVRIWRKLGLDSTTLSEKLSARGMKRSSGTGS